MRSLIAIILFTTTFLPTQIDAACAWILWTKGTHIFKSTAEPYEMAWEPTAFDTHQECKVAKANWLTGNTKTGETINPEGNDIVSIERDSVTSILLAKCLPDTMKPSE